MHREELKFEEKEIKQTNLCCISTDRTAKQTLRTEIFENNFTVQFNTIPLYCRVTNSQRMCQGAEKLTHTLTPVKKKLKKEKRRNYNSENIKSKAKSQTYKVRKIRSTSCVVCIVWALSLSVETSIKYRHSRTVSTWLYRTKYWRKNTSATPLPPKNKNKQQISTLLQENNNNNDSKTTITALGSSEERKKA